MATNITNDASFSVDEYGRQALKISRSFITEVCGWKPGVRVQWVFRKPQKGLNWRVLLEQVRPDAKGPGILTVKWKKNSKRVLFHQQSKEFQFERLPLHNGIKVRWTSASILEAELPKGIRRSSIYTEALSDESDEVAERVRRARKGPSQPIPEGSLPLSSKSETAIKAILDAIDELGYLPHIRAHAIGTGMLGRDFDLAFADLDAAMR